MGLLVLLPPACDQSEVTFRPNPAPPLTWHQCKSHFDVGYEATHRIPLSMGVHDHGPASQGVAVTNSSNHCDEFGFVESFLKRVGSYSSSPVIPYRWFAEIQGSQKRCPPTPRPGPPGP